MITRPAACRRGRSAATATSLTFSMGRRPLPAEQRKPALGRGPEHLEQAFIVRPVYHGRSEDRILQAEQGRLRAHRFLGLDLRPLVDVGRVHARGFVDHARDAGPVDAGRAAVHEAAYAAFRRGLHDVAGAVDVDAHEVIVRLPAFTERRREVAHGVDTVHGRHQGLLVADLALVQADAARLELLHERPFRHRRRAVYG